MVCMSHTLVCPVSENHPTQSPTALFLKQGCVKKSIGRLGKENNRTNLQSNVVNIYSKTSLNQLTMGPTLSDPFTEVVGLGSLNICMSDRLGPK